MATPAVRIRDGASMDEDNPQTRRLMIEAGNLVILHPDGPAGGFPMVIPVDQVIDGQHWFLGSCSPLTRGETLIVESPVPNDARYVTRATVTARSPETFALALEPVWERVQQRAFVRISAHGLQVRVERHSPQSPPEDSDEASDSAHNSSHNEDVHQLVDISAGGIRFESDVDYAPGEDVICHFELPGSLCFVLPARIVRSPESPTTSIHAAALKTSVAVEFTGLDENNRSQLLRWVYREQVRRHRQEDREEAKAAERAAARRQSRR